MLQAFRRGEIPPKSDDGTYAGALKAIQYREYIEAKIHLPFMNETFMNAPERTRSGVPLVSVAQVFARRFQKRLLKNWVPAYITEACDNGFKMQHCFLSDDQISERAWQIIGNYGKGVAEDLRIEVRWGGDEPSRTYSQWEITYAENADAWVVYKGTE